MCGVCVCVCGVCMCVCVQMEINKRLKIQSKF